MKCPVGKYCDAETGTIEPTDCPKKSYNPVENGDVRKDNIISLYCRVTATILFLNFFILFFCNLNDHIFIALITFQSLDSCLPCEAGYECSSEGLSKMTMCAKGYYSVSSP